MITRALLSLVLAACATTAVYLAGRLVWRLLLAFDRQPEPLPPRPTVWVSSLDLPELRGVPGRRRGWRVALSVTPKPERWLMVSEN